MYHPLAALLALSAVEGDTAKSQKHKGTQRLISRMKYKPVRNFLEHKNYTTAIDVNPHYLTPKMLQFRLQLATAFTAGYRYAQDKYLPCWVTSKNQCAVLIVERKI